MAQKYKLNADLSWKPTPDAEAEIEAKAGEIRDDLHPDSITWLREQELIELIEESVKAPQPTELESEVKNVD